MSATPRSTTAGCYQLLPATPHSAIVHLPRPLTGDRRACIMRLVSLHGYITVEVLHEGMKSEVRRAHAESPTAAWSSSRSRGPTA